MYSLNRFNRKTFHSSWKKNFSQLAFGASGLFFCWLSNKRWTDYQNLKEQDAIAYDIATQFFGQSREQGEYYLYTEQTDYEKDDQSFSSLNRVGPALAMVGCALTSGSMKQTRLLVILSPWMVVSGFHMAILYSLKQKHRKAEQLFGEPTNALEHTSTLSKEI